MVEKQWGEGVQEQPIKGSSHTHGKASGPGKIGEGAWNFGKGPWHLRVVPCVHLANGTQCLGQGVQLILDSLQGALDGVRTVQDINGQCVRVKLHGEWALDTRGIVPVRGKPV